MHVKFQVILDDIKSVLRGVFSRTGQAIKGVEHVLQCAALYVGATVMDYLTSMHFPPGVQESNPFARHADGTFWLKHAIITDSVFSLMTVFLSLGCFIGARVLGSKRIALFAAGLPWLIFGYMHLDAAFQNLLVEIPNLYQTSPLDMLRSLLH